MVDLFGADNLGGTSANRVSDVNADTVGLASGVESRAIDVRNLPEHEHDLRSPKGAQFYVILDDSGTLKMLTLFLMMLLLVQVQDKLEHNGWCA